MSYTPSFDPLDPPRPTLGAPTRAVRPRHPPQTARKGDPDFGWPLIRTAKELPTFLRLGARGLLAQGAAHGREHVGLGGGEQLPTEPALKRAKPLAH